MDRGVSILQATSAEAAHGWRLDRALADAAPTLSRERLKALIAGGQVSRAGDVLRDPASKAVVGDVFAITVPLPTPAHNEAQAIPLVIPYEDEHLVIIRRRATSTARWSTRCSTIAAVRCRVSAGSRDRALFTGLTRIPPG